MRRIAVLLAAIAWLSPCWLRAQSVVYEGGRGPGKGKHIVFVVGDQEYRSEESMPALAKILARRHGFKCTVLLPINQQTGEILWQSPPEYMLRLAQTMGLPGG